MKVLMIGVDKTSVGGMLTVVKNYLNNKEFCRKTNLLYIPSVINSSNIIKILFFIYAYIKIITIVLFTKIDIVHIHMAERTSVYREGLIAKTVKILGCKVIIHMHGANIETWYNEQSEKKKKWISFFINAGDKIIILGENWRPFMEKVITDKNKIVVIYNAVETFPKNLYNINAKDIIFLGMLIQRKGINDLLEAFKLIQSEIPQDICLKLYGDDKNKNINELIVKKGLSDRVIYCGWLTNDKKAVVFKNCLLNILPSYNEGLPMSILETMSYGIPNISTDIAAIPELIKDGENGILIKPGNINELAKSLSALINDKNKLINLSSKAFATIIGNFSINTHLNKIYDLYEDLLGTYKS